MSQEIITQADQALELTKAEIDIQVTTAKRYPRSLEAFKQNALAMVKSSKETAQSCNYCITRAGKSIKGPSIRMAEIIQNTWGNMRTGAKVLDEGKEFVIVQGACHDLESNVAVSVEVKRRITNKQGKRYSADMVQTTTAAAISIAIRNAVFKVIPRVYIDILAGEAEKIALGSPDDFPNLVKQWMDYFIGMGISKDAILGKLGIEKVTQISKAHLITLQGIANALKDNMTTLETEFPAKMKEPQAAPESDGEQAKSDEDFLFEEGQENENNPE